MRANTNLWWLLAAFFFIVATAYTAWSIIFYSGDLVGRIEWVGSITLHFAARMSALIAFYVQRVHRAQGGELPEDTLPADIDAGDPEIGEFSPWRSEEHTTELQSLMRTSYA